MESSPTGNSLVLREEQMSDIEMREAQIVFLELESRWNDERQRSPKLMREVEQAEGRLMRLFMDGWAEHPVMASAWSHYRRMLLRSCGRNKQIRQRCRCLAHDVQRTEDGD